MASITVHCTDGTIRLNGDFQSRLAEVKALKNRKYDGASKAWTVDAPMAYFSGYDVVRSADAAKHTGDHVTRYGTTYTSNEWSGLQAGREAKAQAAAAFAPEYNRRKGEAETTLRSALLAAGSNPDTLERLIGVIQSGDKFWRLVEARQIRFQTPGRQALVEAAVEAYEEALGRLALDADDRETAAEEAAYDAHGVR